MMRYSVRHTTEYIYPSRVSHCYNLAYVIPRNSARQQCKKSHIHVEPVPANASRSKDYFGNSSYHFEIQTPHERLVITAVSEVEVQAQNTALKLDFGITCAHAREILETSKNQEVLETREFLLDSPMVRVDPALHEYALPSFQPDRPLLSSVRDLTRRIHSDFAYDPESTTIATPLEEVLRNKRGVCQDFAHLEIGCLRAMGIPARYISGYIETLPPPGQEKMVGSDASHAWIAVYSPTEGWYEFDPTNDQLAADQHIVTAWGRDYYDVTPVKGVIFGGGDSPELKVAVDVNRLS